MPTTGATRIVFDLDGTLVHTRIASWEVFQRVDAEFDLGIDTLEAYYALWERNMFEALRAHCGDPELGDAVITRFLELLESDYHPELVPGIADVIRALAPSSTLAVLSSNSTAVIRRILDRAGVQYCFSHVFGGDVEPDKVAGLRRFLGDAAQGAGRRCSAAFDEVAGAESATAADTVLVTDTVGDIEAALTAGVRAVGVSWGMHDPRELQRAGAEFVASWPQELVSHLRVDPTASCPLPPARQEAPAPLTTAGLLTQLARQRGSAAAPLSSVDGGCTLPQGPARLTPRGAPPRLAAPRSLPPMTEPAAPASTAAEDAARIRRGRRQTVRPLTAHEGQRAPAPSPLPAPGDSPAPAPSRELVAAIGRIC